MRGILAEEFGGADKGNYTDVMVLHSAAGYYIGTLFNNPEGYQEPGSRESEYFGSAEEAQQALDNLSWIQRDHP